jgi:hypothetical protein
MRALVKIEGIEEIEELVWRRRFFVSGQYELGGSARAGHPLAKQRSRCEPQTPFSSANCCVTTQEFGLP